MNKEIKQLATDIVKYLDEVNHYTFTNKEKIEGYKSIVYNIQNGYNDTLNALQEEYNNTNDKDCLELINRLKKVIWV